MVYESVINDVVDSCREMFADERVDETILDELKAAWRQRMIDSGALPSATTRVNQQAALYMPVQSGQKGHGGLITGQMVSSSSRQSSATMSNVPQMVIGQQQQQRISATHVLSQAAIVATSAIRSHLKPISDVGGMVSSQGLLQQQTPQQGRNVISAVIVPVTTKSATNSDMKTQPAISRRVQLDGRFDGHGQGSSAASSSGAASGGRGGSSREPPEKKFARGGAAPVSDDSDLSDSEIAGLDEFAAVAADDAGVASAALGEDEEPLNSGDDVSEAEVSNVVYFDAAKVASSKS